MEINKTADLRDADQLFFTWDAWHDPVPAARPSVRRAGRSEGLFVLSEIVLYQITVRQSDDFFISPFPGMPADLIDYCPEDEVDDHGDPWSGSACAGLEGQDISSCNPDAPHNENRSEHGELYVSGGTQGLWEFEGQRP